MDIVKVERANFRQFQNILKMSENPMEDLDQYLDAPFRRCYILKDHNIICGYIDFSILYERAELNQIYIIKSYRKKHCACLLMDFMLQQCVMNHCCNITLEVRESNIPAQKLYQKYQFQVVAKRYRYYKNEDAILMERKL